MAEVGHERPEMPSLDEFRYIVNHVFLPSRLPQHDDYDQDEEEVLLKAVIYALRLFKDYVQGDQIDVIDSALATMKTLHHHPRFSGDTSIPAERDLAKAFQGLGQKDGKIALHIRAQNCGIIFERRDASIQVEMFELSPLNEAVISSKGRLRRVFPGCAVSVPLEVFQSRDFQATVAYTLTKMSFQPAPGTKTKVKKSNEMLDEDRDTTHPKMVTELFFSFLLSVGGSRVDVPSIWKNTREEVFWQNCRSPWHRSALWLSIRVVLQLHFARSDAHSNRQEQMYKEFMLFFMAKILESAQEHDLPAELFLVMSAKVSRRCQKLAGAIPTAVSDFVELTQSTTNNNLSKRWSKIQDEDRGSGNLHKLSSLEFEKDTLIRLPDLDGFVASFANRGDDDAPFTLNLNCPLNVHNVWAATLSSLSDPTHMIYKLAAFEIWVASEFNRWSTTFGGRNTLCAQIRKKIEEYHVAAHQHYDGNPELTSVMILTILELWVASDKDAIQACSLLEDYEPAIRADLFQNLNLPLRGQMERLLKIEKYLKGRFSRATIPASKVFGDLGLHDSFSVRYFEQSPEHRELLRTIESDARKKETEKREEFRRKKHEYQKMMQQYDQKVHETTVIADWRSGQGVERCLSTCSKCTLQRQASKMEIQIHEWPLPRGELKAQSIVFELRVPQFFGHWRDTTVFVLLNVLKWNYKNRQDPYYKNPLKTCLPDYFRGFSSWSRIGLLSQTKPHVRTHRFEKDIITMSENDVCLQSGLQLRYYDSTEQCFVGDFEPTQLIAESCTYPLPREVPGAESPIQQFIYRPKSNSNGPSPNSALATLSDCPDSLTLEEYKALVSLPLGCKIQWKNILVQLASPNVDFDKEETAFVVLQCIFQAGPCKNGSVLRNGHVILDDDTQFAYVLLDNLYEALQRVEENWQSGQALGIFVAITRRLTSLTSIEDVRFRCLELLADMRQTALTWLNVLEHQVQLAADEDTKAELRSRATKIALVCVDTLNIDGEYLRDLLSSEKHACTMIQCAIVIQEGQSCIPKTPQSLTSILNRRWERLALRGHSILREEITSKKNPALTHAIRKLWPAFHAEGVWVAMKNPYDHWVSCKSTSENGSRSVQVTFSLLTGELLINGSPLSRLPREYESHPMYSTLFGKSILEVVPSSVPGMRFSSIRDFNDHRLDLGFDPNGNLSIRAIIEGQIFELIPRQVLEKSFPNMFINDNVHWYNINDGYLEFCHHGHPWHHSSQNWRLVHAEGDRWQLVKDRGKSMLVNIHSETAASIGRILEPLETLAWMQITSTDSALDIELPRLKLGFNLRQGESSVVSRQFRGLSVDKDQSIGTLTGLRSKLVLKGDNDRVRRKVIIPSGDVEFHRRGSHVLVVIDKHASTKIHAFEVDNLLGRLVDNGSLQSKLLISYLHALTSFPLPDPLTGKTGTEEALSILRSAAVRSFKFLTQEDVDLLTKIASLTPKRTYYPPTAQEMQTVGWSPKLGFLAQHGGFFQIVRSIFDQAETLRFLYEESYTELPTLHGVEQKLLERDLIRSSTFRVSNFGAEDYTTELDHKYYEARDRNQNSAEASQAFAIASSILNPDIGPKTNLSGDLKSDILAFLSHHRSRPIFGRSFPLAVSHINYDAGLLLNMYKSIALNWIPLHLLLSTSNERPDKFRVMFWLGTLSFGKEVNMTILRVLASLYTTPGMSAIDMPDAVTFDLSNGHCVSESNIYPVINEAFVDFIASPEAELVRNPGESDTAYHRRRGEVFEKNKREAKHTFCGALVEQWPCNIPTRPHDTTGWSRYINVALAMTEAESLFRSCFNNRQLVRYLGAIDRLFPRDVHEVRIPRHTLTTPQWTSNGKSGFVSNDAIFSYPAPVVPPRNIDDMTRHLSSIDSDREVTLRLPSLLSKLVEKAQSGYEERYIAGLEDSARSLRCWRKEYRLGSGTEELEEFLASHWRECREVVNVIYDAMLKASTPGQEARQSRSLHWPRLSSTFFLQRLSRQYWQKLPENWKSCIVHYGVAITQLQRAGRLLGAINNSSTLISELKNPGHTNWNPREHPESLLMEIESGIMIRPVQEQISTNMISPRIGGNAVMQLNMGEGKSSVIVPRVAVALADGFRMVRVVVGKPQSKQMYEMLLCKLGGLLNRRIYHMPFSRTVKVERREMILIRDMFDKCTAEGGVLLVQPEHILSFKLMGIEGLLTGRESIGKGMGSIQGDLDRVTRDIVDESDENFSVKFELVYTMGTQRPTEHSPDRWICIHQVLEIVRKVASEVWNEFPSSLELHFQAPGCFPLTRILQSDAGNRILSEITSHICNTGIDNFPIARQPEVIRSAVHRYISQPEPAAADIERVEDPSSGGFWTGVSQTLLLLRGLVAGGILTFALGLKRWRVDYGLAPNRLPGTKLAVPYRAKDNPSPRSEFSHPDVVIILTSLSYYYGGLDDEDLLRTFDHLVRSDQADQEYQVWVRDAGDLPPAFKQLAGVNLKDRIQCTQQVFPHLRYAKGVIDYFLSHIVFPKEMKEFPHRLSASGWDLGEAKAHPTTGFSGTNDSRQVLPLLVKQLDLEDQKHTNALVLENLLQPENSVALMPPRGEIDGPVAEMLLDIIIKMDPPTRVILDVGAQILELDNFEVAQAWLSKTSDVPRIEAAIFFDNNDEMCVMDRKGHVESLQASPFASQLDVCVVFLDEAHTRGTDLKLPRDYRAAVTLGANLTKDRLVQACMRMRMLGEGQSVVFCVPEEIQRKIQANRPEAALYTQEISVQDILAWSIGETWRDIHRNMALWALQGRRNEKHQTIWAEARSGTKVTFNIELAEKYLEDEAQTLEQKYRPRRNNEATMLGQQTNEDAMDPISLRCREFKNLKLDSAALHEEEERELSPEIEHEREDQRPSPADPASHKIHLDIKMFLASGSIFEHATGYGPAFLSLRNTSAGALFDTSQFRAGLLVSVDFARTVQRRSNSDTFDSYQRPVQWILTSAPPNAADSLHTTIKHMMVISPFEAQELLPRIAKSKVVALHLYAPRSNMAYRRLDTLDLYTIPEELKSRHIPQRLITELNLFAGQLYFDSFEQYVDACKFLGLGWDTPGEGEEIGADGFILRDRFGRVGGESGLQSSPVAFFKLLHTKIRRNCESIDKTHMGKLLDNQLLKPSDFEKEEAGGVDDDSIL
ncbi:hypothetical protein GGR54DRAFT_590862 [Hypoxylon sp. NC1633]|nr:hypothetical protein GGR54DRAFT_590862 [Hypoxylon sp. NC1633]